MENKFSKHFTKYMSSTENNAKLFELMRQNLDKSDRELLVEAWSKNEKEIQKYIKTFEKESGNDWLIENGVKPLDGKALAKNIIKYIDKNFVWTHEEIDAFKDYFNSYFEKYYKDSNIEDDDK